MLHTIPGCYPTHAPWCSNDGCGHTRHLWPRRVTEICPWWNTPWHTHTHSLAVMKLVSILSSLHLHQAWVRGHDVVATVGMTPPNEWYLHWPGVVLGVVTGTVCILYTRAGNDHSQSFTSWRRPLLKPLRNYFNLPTCLLWSLHRQHNFKSTCY